MTGWGQVCPQGARRTEQDALAGVSPYRIHKVLRLTGVPGIPLTFGATLTKSLRSTFRTMAPARDWDYSQRQARKSTQGEVWG